MRLVKSQKPDAAYWLNRYLADKRTRLSASTRRNYRQVIGRFVAACDRWPPARADVLAWLEEIEAQASRITAWSYWSILRSWLNYLELVGAIEANPAAEISRLRLAPTQPKIKPRGVPELHARALLDWLRLQPGLVARRDLALLHFLWRSGARVGEAVSLTRPALDLAGRCAWIAAGDSKTDEDREIFFGRAVAGDLAAWLGELDRLGYGEGWLFPTTRGERPRARSLTVSGVNQMFHRRLDRAGLPRYRVHDLRHSFTKAAMRAGISLASIQRQLGHATPDMVLRYAQAFDAEQRREFINFGD